MEHKLDKLGRKISQFDRSASGRKAIETRKRKNHVEYKRAVSLGGSRRTRGHFGKLKDEGKDDEIRTLSRKAAEVRQKNKETRDGDGGENSAVSDGQS